MAVPEFSPRLRSVLDSCFADLNDEGISSGICSVADSFDPGFKLAVVPQNQATNVTEQAQRLATLGVANFDKAAGSQAGSSFLHSFAPGRGQHSETVLFKQPKKVSAKPYEQLLDPDLESSNKEIGVMHYVAEDVLK